VCIALRGTPSHCYGVSLAIWDHSVTWHNWTHPALTPPEASTQFIYPRGREGWVDLGGWLHTENCIIAFCLWICAESCGKAEPGTVSVCVKLGDLSLGEPGSWSSRWSSSVAAHVAAFYASLSRPQHHQTWVSLTFQINTFTCTCTTTNSTFIKQANLSAVTLQ